MQAIRKFYFMPAVVLSYANDKNGSLTWLQDEFDAINSYFINNNVGEVEVIALPNVSLKTLADVFAARSKDIILFHFSGHADQFNLFLKDEKSGGSPGIAQILGTAENLKFVFLNGCATKEHVSQLHNANVNAVIATSRKIDDKLAAGFAITFYSGLCRHLVLNKSFDLAKGLTLADNKIATFLPSNSRHFGTKDITDNADFPWGIYYKEQDDSRYQEQVRKNIEDWTLPEKGITPVFTANNYKPSYYFIEEVAKRAERYFNILDDQATSKLDESVEEEFTSLINYYNDKYNKDSYTFRSLSDSVKNIMPYPLSVRLEKVIQIGNEILEAGKNEQILYDKYYDLLKAQINFYQSIIKIYGITMIADLYNFLLPKNDKSKVIITKGQYECITGFFNITAENKDDFDYTSLVKTTRQFLESNGIIPFIKEYRVLKQFFIFNEDLFEAHMEISSLKYRVNAGKIDRSEIQSYCQKAETLLWKVFEKVCFVLRYKLIVITKIEILKYRIDEPKFVHNRIILHKSLDDYLPEDDVILPTGKESIKNDPGYTDSYSVMLFRGLSDFSSFLNLSPLAIDLNVLKGEDNSLLYLYSHMDQGGGIVYEEVQNPKESFSISVNKDGSIDYVKSLGKVPKIQKRITSRLTALCKQFERLKMEIKELEPYIKIDEQELKTNEEELKINEVNIPNHD